MATSTLSNTILDTLGAAVQNCEVIIDLIPGPAFKTGSGEELASRISVLTDATGKWTAILERTGDITPSGTYYRVKERIPKNKGGEKLWYFTVPVASPTTLLANLVNPNTSAGVLLPFVVTSSTRPSNPFIGMMIFETDTGKVLYYYGSTLLWQPQWNVAWGEIAQTADATAHTTTSTAYTDAGVSVAFTAINGRRYLTMLQFQATLAGGATAPSVSVALTDPANTVLAEQNFNPSSTAFILGGMWVIHRSSGSETGSITRKARFKMATGTGTAGISGSLGAVITATVFDIGQASAPVIT